MNKSPRTREIKQAQKESQLLREISRLFLSITFDQPELKTLYVNRVKLSPDGGVCTIYFMTTGGKEEFENKRKTLVLYKPSLRTALAKTIHSRYTPELVFRYDEQFEKQRSVDELIDKLKEEGKL